MKDLDLKEDSFVLSVTTKNSSKEEKWQDLFSNKAFVIVFQPGAGNSAAGKDMENWLNKGLGGCTNEAQDFGNNLKEFDRLKISVFIVNSLDPGKQKEIIDSKKFNEKLTFISDPDFELALLMGVHNIKVNDTIVHEPTIGIYRENGKCVETIFPQNKGCNLTSRISSDSILQSCINNLSVPKKNHPVQEKTISMSL